MPQFESFSSRSSTRSACASRRQQRAAQRERILLRGDGELVDEALHDEPGDRVADRAPRRDGQLGLDRLGGELEVVELIGRVLDALAREDVAERVRREDRERGAADHVDHRPGQRRQRRAEPVCPPSSTIDCDMHVHARAGDLAVAHAAVDLRGVHRAVPRLRHVALARPHELDRSLHALRDLRGLRARRPPSRGDRSRRRTA